MLRAAAASRTEFGNEVADYMRAGDLVPDVVMNRVIEQRLEQHDTRNRGFVLDGYPRTVGQAETLEELLAPTGLDLVLDMELPTDVAIARLANRRVCSDCGSIYGLDERPRYAGMCDNCGGSLAQRDDDTQESIARRLQLYGKETEPLIEWYLTRRKLASVDGLGTAEQVTSRLIRAIDNRRRGRRA